MMKFSLKYNQLLIIAILVLTIASCKKEKKAETIPAKQIEPALEISNKKMRKATVMESVGATNVTVEYDRLLTDSVAKPFGKTIPFGKPWNAGNAVFIVSKPVTIHGKTLPAGKYDFFTIPEQIDTNRKRGTHKLWTIIFTKHIGKSQKTFVPKNEVLRLQTRAQLEDNSKDHMEYFFEERNNEKILRLLFEFVEVHIPFEEVSQTSGEIAKAMVMNSIGTTEIIINYERVRANNKEIFGKVVPYNTLWNPGNHTKTTTISFSDSVLFEGAKIPKGTYSLNIVPKKDANWQIILHKDFSTNPKVVFSGVANIELAASGPNRLEFFFDYISDNESQIYLVWDRATTFFTVKNP